MEAAHIIHPDIALIRRTNVAAAATTPTDVCSEYQSHMAHPIVPAVRMPFKKESEISIMEYNRNSLIIVFRVSAIAPLAYSSSFFSLENNLTDWIFV